MKRRVVYARKQNGKEVWREKKRKGELVVGSVDEKKQKMVVYDVDEDGEEQKSKLETNEMSSNAKSYVDSAFRSAHDNQFVMFVEHLYYVVYYDPASPKKDRVIKGPMYISDGFPSLRHTAFEIPGIEAAFGCHRVNEAFIFSYHSCAKIKYAPDTHEGEVIEGPNMISWIFPCLAGTTFARAVDAAFESTRTGEAYLFTASEYALINYSTRTLVTSGLILDGFPCLRDTMFASGIGAAFASHKPNEAYLFKDNSYVLLHFTPGETNSSYIIEGPKEVVPSNWPSLRYFPCDPTGRWSCEPFRYWDSIP